MAWYPLSFIGKNSDEINLNLTLKCGQAFRWQYVKGEWRCAFDGFIAQLKQKSNLNVFFYSTEENRFKINNFLNNYFRCNESLSDLFNQWKLSDSRFESVFTNFKGIRLLRQSPVENLFSFICSSNNNIGRIVKLVSALSSNYGSPQLLLEDDKTKTLYHSFPSIDKLCVDNLEVSLRSLGFGYRAKYIKNTAVMIQKDGGEEKLLELKTKTYEEAKDYLLSLSGVGNKVADCVLLGSLDHLDSVPIDIHMFNVVKKHYAHLLDSNILHSKSLTPLIYNQIRNLFNKIWKPQSGWAQLVIFASDLKPSTFETDKNMEDSKKKRKRKSESSKLEICHKKK